MDRDALIKRLNKQLGTIKSRVESRRIVNQKLEPGLVFYLAYKDEKNVQRACQILALKSLRNKSWLCCKMSIELSYAGPFDIVCNPDEWTGGYSILIEPWNTISIDEDSVVNEPAHVVSRELMDKALTINDAYVNKKEIPEQISILCGSEMDPNDELDDRWDFQESESDIINRVQQKYSRVAPINFIQGKATIRKKFPVDRRAGFQIPFSMAGLSKGKVIPVHDISPPAGEWDLIHTKGDDRPNCIVTSDVILSSWVEEAEIKHIRWFEINTKVFAALAHQNTRKKILDLEKILKDTKYDPYVALNLAWVLLFGGEREPAFEYLLLAEKNFSTPVYLNITTRSKKLLMSDTDLDKAPPFIDVWRIRCQTSDQNKRISELEKIWSQSNDGYVAYEIAEEYKYKGALSYENLNYEFYNEMRSWAYRSLSAPIPIADDLRIWVEEIVNIITEPASNITETKKPYFHIPLKAA